MQMLSLIGTFDRFAELRESPVSAGTLAGIEHGSNVVDLDAAPKGALRF
jgi:hypothetical protein